MRHDILDAHPCRTRVRHLTLPGLETNHSQSRAWSSAAAQRQLANCERILAAEHRTPLARFRRCDFCDGIEDTRTPHQHGAAA